MSVPCQHLLVQPLLLGSGEQPPTNTLSPLIVGSDFIFTFSLCSSSTPYFIDWREGSCVLVPQHTVTLCYGSYQYYYFLLHKVIVWDLPTPLMTMSSEHDELGFGVYLCTSLYTTAKLKKIIINPTSVNWRLCIWPFFETEFG